jgi:tetratricopeptide (TPR) repeat protein
MNSTCRVKLFTTAFCIILGIIISPSRQYHQVIAQLPQTTQMSAEDYFERGIENAYSNPKQALANFTQAIQLQPNYALAYYERGRLLAGRGWQVREPKGLPGAIADFTQAIRLIPNYAEAYYERGLTYSELGKKQEAIADYIRMLQLDPNSEAYREDNKKALADYTQIVKTNFDFAHVYYRGLAHFYLRNTQAAVADFTQAIQINPNFATAYLYRGRATAKAYYYRGEAGYADKAVLADYTKAIQLNSSLADAYYYRSRARTEQPKLAQEQQRTILEDFTRAISLDPTFADAYYLRGLVFSRLGNELQAVEDFIQALKLAPTAYALNKEVAADYIQALQVNPQNAGAYYRRGLVRYHLEDTPGALRDYTQAIKLNPNLAEAYFARGHANRFRRQQAIADFTQAIKLSPNLAEAYLARGIARKTYNQTQQEIAKEIKDYNQVIRLNPKLADAYYQRARAIIRSRLKRNYVVINDREAVANLTQSLRLSFDVEHFSQFLEIFFFEVRDALSSQPWLKNTAYFEVRDAQRTIEQYTKAIQNNPADANAFYQRGWIWLKLRDLKAALEDFNQAVRLNSQDANFYYSRGLAYYHRKNYDKAISDYTEAIRLNPDFADAYFSRGLARYDIGDKQGAIADTTQAIKLDPKNANARFIRRLAWHALGGKGEAEEDDERIYYFQCIRGCAPSLSALSGKERDVAYYHNRGLTLARRGDKQKAIENLQIAANLYQVQGNTQRYRELQNLIIRLQR